MSLPAALRNLRKSPGVKAQWRAVADDVFTSPGKPGGLHPQPRCWGPLPGWRRRPCTQHSCA
jgi:hypothetical protein